MKPVIDCRAFILTIIFTLFACAGMPLKDYNPRSTNEEEIIEVITQHEKAWNEQNLSGFMATYHRSALIEDGCNGPLISASESTDRIKHLMAEYPTVKFVNPQLKVSENEAVVKLTSTELGDERHRFTLEMLKENDRWRITKESCY